MLWNRIFSVFLPVHLIVEGSFCIQKYSVHILSYLYQQLITGTAPYCVSSFTVSFRGKFSLRKEVKPDSKPLCT